MTSLWAHGIGRIAMALMAIGAESGGLGLRHGPALVLEIMQVI